MEYFVVENKTKAVILICNETITVLKEYNIHRHYDAKHRAKYSGLIGLMHSQKLESMKKRSASQQQTFIQKQHENESIIRASFHVAEILAKAGKPFTDSDKVKTCLLKVAKKLVQKRVQFKAVSLSANTIAR